MPARFTHTHSVTADGDLIGRWSMLDPFVISLTMSLINRDQILAFTMGPAAFYFGAAVILTILAVEWLDSRLLWDAHESGNARFGRLKRRLKINAVSHLLAAAVHRANDCWLADLGQLSGPGAILSPSTLCRRMVLFQAVRLFRYQGVEVEQCRISASATIFVRLKSRSASSPI